MSQSGTEDFRTRVKEKYVPKLRAPFGQLGDFWARYDKMADRHDKEMIKILNGNLDVLLIFAGLFSAVNTSFISFTMPALSPDPSEETNHLLRLILQKADNSSLTADDLSPTFSADGGAIGANCLLYASLCCSLLAAAGAMITKEWLQSFERSGQAGPIEHQARLRQRKFNGVKEWHLEAIILFLPNLLLIAVGFFFAGTITYLFPVNKLVSGIVIAFAFSGSAFVLGTIIAGTIYPNCPYQTTVSSAMRRLIKYFHPVQLLAEHYISMLAKRARLLLGSAEATTTAVLRREVNERTDAVLTADALYWVLANTSDTNDQRVVLESICNLELEACNVFADSDERFSQILNATHSSMKAYCINPTRETRTMAELQCATLCYIISDRRFSTRQAEISSRFEEMGDSEVATGIGTSRTRIWEMGLWHALMGGLPIENPGFPSSRSMKNLNLTFQMASVGLLRKIVVWSPTERNPTCMDLTGFIAQPYDDIVLSLLGLYIHLSYSRSTTDEDRVTRALESYRGQHLARNLVDALGSIHYMLKKCHYTLTLDFISLFWAILDRCCQYDIAYRDRDYYQKTILTRFPLILEALIGQGEAWPFYCGNIGCLLLECINVIKGLEWSSLNHDDDSSFSKLINKTLASYSFILHRVPILEASLSPDAFVCLLTKSMTDFDMPRHPWFVSYLVKQVSRRKVSEGLLHAVDRMVRHESQTGLAETWMVAGLGKSLISVMRDLSNSDPPWNNLAAPTMITYLTESSPRWARTLINDGLLDACVDQIFAWPDRSTTPQYGYQFLMWKILLLVKAQTVTLPGVNWYSAKMIKAISINFPAALKGKVARYPQRGVIPSNFILDRFPTFGMQPGIVSFPLSSMAELMKEAIRMRLATCIATGSHSSIASSFDEFRRLFGADLSIDWSYGPYGTIEPPAPCSRVTFTCDVQLL